MKQEDEQSLIRPRTMSERKAYMTGYADAILECKENGVASAAGWLKFMFEAEEGDDAGPS